jgi:endogenous inhibitor of DNA gyrase (YacG/DUF329 family)
VFTYAPIGIEYLTSEISNGSRFLPIVSSIANIGAASLTLLVIISIWIQVKNYITHPIEVDLRKFTKDIDYDKRIEFIEKFHSDLHSILDAYISDKRIYIFIDDLDRCQIPKAAELIQSINLMIADDPRLIFIIGMDREKVAAGIASKYDDILPYLRDEVDLDSADNQTARNEGLMFGYQYLEKFIQIPFLVPQPRPSDIQGLTESILPDQPDADNHEDNIINNEFDSLFFREAEKDTLGLRTRPVLDKNPELFREAVTMVAPALEHNPRKIKKFINLFRLRALLANEQGLFNWMRLGQHSRPNLTLQQLAKFVAISIQWPQLLSQLNRQPELLGELQHIAIDQSSEHVSEEANHWSNNDRLMELLESGCVDNNSDPDWYSLAHINVDNLLQISPRTDQPVQTQEEQGTDTSETTTKRTSTSDNTEIDPVNEEVGIDETFPWLPYRETWWDVPCPGCGEKIHNTRTSFTDHWTYGNCTVTTEDIKEVLERDGVVTNSITDFPIVDSGGNVSISRTPEQSHPWLPYPDSDQRRVPCPKCGEFIHNSKDSFERHWENSDSCSGLDSDEVEQVAAQLRSISEENGEFPWLPYSREEWKVPCPECGARIHNTLDNFQEHWENSDQCEGISGNISQYLIVNNKEDQSATV